MAFLTDIRTTNSGRRPVPGVSIVIYIPYIFYGTAAYISPIKVFFQHQPDVCCSRYQLLHRNVKYYDPYDQSVVKRNFHCLHSFNETRESIQDLDHIELEKRISNGDELGELRYLTCYSLRTTPKIYFLQNFDWVTNDRADQPMSMITKGTYDYVSCLFSVFIFYFHTFVICRGTCTHFLNVFGQI